MVFSWFKKAAAMLSVAAVSTAALGACGGGGGQTGNLASDQTLNFPIYDDFGSLDPAQINAETDSEIAGDVFNNLVIFDKDLKIVPDIASALPTISSDNLTYTFKLRHDVTFSNGDKLTAKDILYTLNRADALQGPYSTTFGSFKGNDVVSANKKSGAALEALLEKNDPSVTLSGVTAPDDYTVVIQLTKPAGWLLSALALYGSVGSIVDVNAVKQDPDNWWTKPETLVGTGAFKMTARVPKQSVDFAAVSNWWGDPKPTLKKVHIDILQNPSSGVTAWEQKKYDIDGYGGYSNIPIADVLRISNTGSEKNDLKLIPKARSYWADFSFKSGSPFSGDAGKPLRQAFALAVDKQKLVQVVCHNLVCSPATGGVIVKGLKAYLGDNGDPLAKFDAAQAKTLLKQGDPSGSKTKDLTYAYDPNNPLNGPTATFLQDQWQTNLGVHVNIQAVSHSPFIKARCKTSYVMARDGWQADYDHPQDWFDNQWGAAATKAGCNSSSYDTPAFDTLAQKADSEPLDTAVSDYVQMHKMLSDDVVYIPLYYSVGAFLIHSWVQGAGSNKIFDNYWNRISILQH